MTKDVSSNLPMLRIPCEECLVNILKNICVQVSCNLSKCYSNRFGKFYGSASF